VDTGQATSVMFEFHDFAIQHNSYIDKTRPSQDVTTLLGVAETEIANVACPD